MDTFSNDIDYQNSCGDSRRCYAVWHAKLGVACLSFYNREKDDDLVFAEDFNLETLIKMRDELTKIIESAAFSPAAGKGDEGNGCRATAGLNGHVR